MTDRIIEVYQTEVDHNRIWRWRVNDGATVMRDFRNYESRDEAVADALRRPGNHDLDVLDIPEPDRP